MAPGRLNGSATPSSAELERHFAPAFLKAVPPDSLLESLGSISPGRPFTLVSVSAERPAPARGAPGDARRCRPARVDSLSRRQRRIAIEGLCCSAPSPPSSTSWSEVDAALRRLGARATLYAGAAGGRHRPRGARRRGRRDRLGVQALRPRRARPRGRGGDATWQERLAIRDAWKSLPSGAMRDKPAGAAFTLRHYAEQMISVSDNTATDHLIGRLGRAAVEAATRLRSATARPRANKPFLTTRELFALKLAAPAALRNAFAAAAPDERRRLLPRVDALVPTLASGNGWTAPRSIDTLEWFASPADLAHAIAALRQPRPASTALRPVRAILASQPRRPGRHASGGATSASRAAPSPACSA